MVRPSVCRLVHYVSYGTPGGEYHSKCRAAVITEVGQWITVNVSDELEVDGQRRRSVEQTWEPEACALHVMNPTGVFFNGAAGVACEHSENDHRGGTWHWPERVEDG
jgi:hypothetical protein